MRRATSKLRGLLNARRDPKHVAHQAEELAGAEARALQTDSMGSRKKLRVREGRSRRPRSLGSSVNTSADAFSPASSDDEEMTLKQAGVALRQMRRKPLLPEEARGKSPHKKSKSQVQRAKRSRSAPLHPSRTFRDNTATPVDRLKRSAEKKILKRNRSASPRLGEGSLSSRERGIAFHTRIQQARLAEATKVLRKARDKAICKNDATLSQHLALERKVLRECAKGISVGTSGRAASVSPSQAGRTLLESDAILHFLSEGCGAFGKAEHASRGPVPADGSGLEGADEEAATSAAGPARIQDAMVRKLQAQRNTLKTELWMYRSRQKKFNDQGRELALQLHHQLEAAANARESTSLPPLGHASDCRNLPTQEGNGARASLDSSRLSEDSLVDPHQELHQRAAVTEGLTTDLREVLSVVRDAIALTQQDFDDQDLPHVFPCAQNHTEPLTPLRAEAAAAAASGAPAPSWSAAVPSPSTFSLKEEGIRALAQDSLPAVDASSPAVHAALVACGATRERMDAEVAVAGSHGPLHAAATGVIVGRSGVNSLETQSADSGSERPRPRIAAVPPAAAAGMVVASLPAARISPGRASMRGFSHARDASPPHTQPAEDDGPDKAHDEALVRINAIFDRLLQPSTSSTPADHRTGQTRSTAHTARAAPASSGTDACPVEAARNESPSRGGAPDGGTCQAQDRQGDSLGPPAARTGGPMSFKELHEIFQILDKNGDGVISHVEFIKGLKQAPWIAEKLGMPARIQPEDGTRHKYQLIFGEIDADDSKNIDFDELCLYYGVQSDETSNAGGQDEGADSTTGAVTSMGLQAAMQRWARHEKALDRRASRSSRRPEAEGSRAGDLQPESQTEAGHERKAGEMLSCNFCGKQSASLLRCQTGAGYCGVSCQHRDWQQQHQHHQHHQQQQVDKGTGGERPSSQCGHDGEAGAGGSANEAVDEAAARSPRRRRPLVDVSQDGRENRARDTMPRDELVGIFHRLDRVGDRVGYRSKLD